MSYFDKETVFYWLTLQVIPIFLVIMMILSDPIPTQQDIDRTHKN